jgi:hypothetical protein
VRLETVKDPLLLTAMSLRAMDVEVRALAARAGAAEQRGAPRGGDTAEAAWASRRR